METLDSYLTKEGWKKDWQKTIERLPQNPLARLGNYIWNYILPDREIMEDYRKDMLKIHQDFGLSPRHYETPEIFRKSLKEAPEPGAGIHAIAFFEGWGVSCCPYMPKFMQIKRNR